MNSIAGRQIRLLLIGGVVATVGAALAIMLGVRVALVADFDRTLEDRIRLLATLVEYNEEHEVEFDEEASGAGAYADVEDPEYFQVWLLGGADAPSVELSRSESLDDGGALPGPGLGREGRGRGGLVHGALRLPDERRGRLACAVLPVTRADEDLPEEAQRDLLARDDRVAITVAASTAPVDRLLARIAATVAIAGVAMLGALGLISLWTVRRGLAPLRAASERVRAIDALQLSERIDAPEAPDELRPLLEALNALLHRLETSFERERLSRAMLAHELRNPIAELLAAAEVAVRYHDDPDLMRRSMGSILEGVRDLHRSVDTLLHVARVQSGQEEPRSQPVDLAQVVRTVLDTHAPLTRSKSLAIDVDAPGRVGATTDPELLHVIVSNLIANAVEYSPAESRVDIRVASGPDGPAFRCANPDPGRAPTPRPNGSAEPGARRRATTHAGLGLAATRTLCQTLGATLRLDRAGGRFTADLVLRASE